MGPLLGSLCIFKTVQGNGLCLILVRLWSAGRVLPNADKPGQTLGMHSAASDDSFIRPQHHGQTSARAKEAVAQAVLGSQDGTSSSGSSNERSSMESNRQSSELSFQASPERRSGSFKAPLTQSLQHLSGDSSNRGVMPYSALQRNLLAQYKAEAERTRPQATAVEDAQGPFGRGQPLQSLPEGTSSTFQVNLTDASKPVSTHGPDNNRELLDICQHIEIWLLLSNLGANGIELHV